MGWMKPITAKIDEELTKQIEQWVNKEYDSNYTSTLNMPKINLDKIDQETNNRSEFIRVRVKEYLRLLNLKYDSPIPLFPSRCEFVRCAVLDYYLDYHRDEEIIEIPKKSEVDKYLEENGLKLIGEA